MADIASDWTEADAGLKVVVGRGVNPKDRPHWGT